MSCSHEFAIYYEHIRAQVGSEFVVSDTDVFHRITRVLRLVDGDTCVFFNRAHTYTLRLTSCKKKSCTFLVESCSEIEQIVPHVTWLLPILQREQLEHAIYMLSVLGASKIIPVVTQKSRNKWGKPKDYERMQRIMVAAAEQSKQFCLPQLGDVQTLPNYLSDLSGDQQRVFFDPEGDDFFSFIECMRQDSKKQKRGVICLVGPEGDLSSSEKELIAQHEFFTYKLTPMILKASHAVTVAMGAIRALV